jgi:DNA-binding MarR family transcriptional regulator
MSQMIERLVRQGLLRRTEDAADRRRKIIVVTPHARALLRKLEIARSSEYELGLVSVSPKIQARLALILEQVIGEVERGRPNEGAAPGRGKRFG